MDRSPGRTASDSNPPLRRRPAHDRIHILVIRRDVLTRHVHASALKLIAAHEFGAAWPGSDGEHIFDRLDHEVDAAAHLGYRCMTLQAISAEVRTSSEANCLSGCSPAGSEKDGVDGNPNDAKLARRPSIRQWAQNMLQSTRTADSGLDRSSPPARPGSRPRAEQ